MDLSLKKNIFAKLIYLQPHREIQIGCLKRLSRSEAQVTQLVSSYSENTLICYFNTSLEFYVCLFSQIIIFGCELLGGGNTL